MIKGFAYNYSSGVAGRYTIYDVSRQNLWILFKIINYRGEEQTVTSLKALRQQPRICACLNLILLLVKPLVFMGSEYDF